MAVRIFTAVNSLRASVTDVIDIHLIGHSRGSVVISQAARQLELNYPDYTRQGYIQMTLLDPHPALNSASIGLGMFELMNPFNITGVSQVDSLVLTDVSVAER